MENQEVISSIQIEVSALRLLCEDLKARTDILEKTVLVGHHGNLPLAEVVRNLSNTVSSYIEQKNKEEAEKKEQEEIGATERRAQINRWTILLASIGIPIILTVLGQAVYFYFKLVPLLVP